MKPFQLITALSSLLPAGTIPTEIVYLPEGENTISATLSAFLRWCAYNPPKRFRQINRPGPFGNE